MHRSTFGRSSVLLGIVLLAAGLGWPLAMPQPALGQDVPLNPDPSRCLVDPYTGDLPPPVEGTTTPRPSPLSDLTLWDEWADETAGEPVDFDLELELPETSIAFFSCSNAGSPLRTYAMVTDGFRQRRPPNAFALGKLGSQASPFLEDSWVGLTSIWAPRAHGEDRAVVFVEAKDPTLCDEEILIALVFAKIGGTWLIDDVARLSGGQPRAYDLPVLRWVDNPRCFEPGDESDAQAPTPVGKADIALPVRGFADTTTSTMTAQDVIDLLEQNDGTVRLEDVEIVGLLDLRGIPSSRFRATRVRFAGGIDVGLVTRLRETELLQRQRMRFMLTDVEISGPANFQWDVFETFECTRCVFDGDALFEAVQAGDLYFQDSRFSADARFVDLVVADRLDLSGVRFDAGADFTGAQFARLDTRGLSTGEPIRIEWSQFGDRWLRTEIGRSNTAGETRVSKLQQIQTALHFWESNFLALGQEQDALTVRARAAEFQRDHRLEWGEWRKWDAWRKSLGSGYGTQPYRPLIVAAVIVILFWVVYAVRDPFVQVEPGKALNRGRPWVFALLYSVDTFVPFAGVTGVRDWGWHITGFRRWAAVGERVVGAIATVIFAYNVGSYLL